MGLGREARGLHSCRAGLSDFAEKFNVLRPASGFSLSTLADAGSNFFCKLEDCKTFSNCISKEAVNCLFDGFAFASSAKRHCCNLFLRVMCEKALRCHAPSSSSRHHLSMLAKQNDYAIIAINQTISPLPKPYPRPDTKDMHFDLFYGCFTARVRV